MDYYPNFAAAYDGPEPSQAGYQRSLAVLRANALRVGIPFWNFFGVESVFGGEPDPTEAQIRWQVFTSLAYGAKGVLYFCYWGGILQEQPRFDGDSTAGLSRSEPEPSGALSWA